MATVNIVVTPSRLPAAPVYTLPITYLQVRRVIEIGIVLLFAPLWLFIIGLIAAGIGISERQQIFFVQNRPGRHGRLFRLYKFRTMYVHCDSSQLTALHDKRITPLGRRLRQYKLDELPQLFNVLKGDMSLIGPRPVPENFYHQYLQQIPLYDVRHTIRPGITGLSQIRLGYTETLEGEKRKLKYDLHYIRHIGLLQDMRIIAGTLQLLTRRQKQ